MTAKVRTCLWFDSNAEDAVDFYVALLPDSTVQSVHRMPPDDVVVAIDFTLAGTPYQALNGGSQFSFTEAASITVSTEDQDETDRLWQALTANGGKEGACAWLKDRFGLSWQIVPQALPRLLGDPDGDAAGRVLDRMMTMSKINIAELEAAFGGEGVIE